MLAVVLVSAAALPADPADSTDKVRLRLNLKEGDSFRFKVVVDQGVNQTVMGQQQAMAQTLGMGQQFDVVHADDSLYRVRVSYYWVMFEQDGPLGRITYNSDDPPETTHPMTAGFATLLGRHITMTMDPLGYISAIDGVEAMLVSMMAQFDSLGSAPPGVKESLRLYFGDETMKAQMENLLAIYPEEEVGVGDTWTKAMFLKTGMPMHLTNTYRLAALEEDHVRIELESIVAPGDGRPMQMGGVVLAYTVSGTQQGTMWLDKATGFPRRVDITQHLAGEASLNNDMTWPIEIHVKNVMETE